MTTNPKDNERQIRLGLSVVIYAWSLFQLFTNNSTPLQGVSSDRTEKGRDVHKSSLRPQKCCFVELRDFTEQYGTLTPTRIETFGPDTDLLPRVHTHQTVTARRESRCLPVWTPVSIGNQGLHPETCARQGIRESTTRLLRTPSVLDTLPG